MRFLFDIGHPAHVHYFKNLISLLQKQNHEIKITARDKEMTLYLLDKYGLDFVSTGKNASSILGKALSLPLIESQIYKVAKQFKPDLIISTFTPYAAHVGKLLDIPVLGITDTEHATLSNTLAKDFTDCLIIPSGCNVDFTNKKVEYDGFLELAYLHPKYYTPDSKVLDFLKITDKENFVILRFVSWNAAHDWGMHGFSLKEKITLSTFLSKHLKVFISSEESLPKELNDYKLQIPPEMIHDALYYATMIIGDGATMSTEAALLGTPSILTNSLATKINHFRELEDEGLIYSTTDFKEIVRRSLHILSSEIDYTSKKNTILKSKISLTDVLMDELILLTNKRKVSK